MTEDEKVIEALRSTPDKIIIGEIRGEDFLKVLESFTKREK